jgi:predicted nucleic acid-binding protein
MDKLVVDSSVAIKWFVPEPYSTEARRILKAYQDGTLALLAPDLFYAEIGNIVWKKHRRHDITADEAQTIIEECQDLIFEITSSGDLLKEAYRIAIAQQRTVYDALYVALSVRERCQCVSADEKLVNAVKSAHKNVIWLADWV